MIFKNKKILVTGAAGFIGANLARFFLKEGAQVSILTRKESNKWRIKDILKSLDERCVDILEYDKLEKTVRAIRPEIVLHTAVWGGYHFQQDTEKIMKVNVLGTCHMARACLKTGFQAFINTGSSSEYGLKNRAMSEKDCLEPVTDYAVAKASSTLFCQALAQRLCLPFVTLRLFSAYGYYEDPTRFISSVIVDCLKNRNPKVSTPEPVRDFVFIEDIVQAYVQAIRMPHKHGEIFNIGTGKQHNLGEAAQEIFKLTGGKFKALWGSVDNTRIEPKNWKADISLALKSLDWQPEHNFRQGLKKTISWFREHLDLYE